jgi:uncharacterized RDD family membrane protein YckC
MESNNFYLNIYRKKSTSELKEILQDINCAVDSKLTAIAVLKEREEASTEILSMEHNLIQQRNENLKKGLFAEDKYNTAVARFLALIIDGFVLGLLSIPFRFFNVTESVFMISLVAFAGSVAPYVYNILLHGFGGQTVGKMFMGIKIYDKSENKIISLQQAFIRDCVPLSLVIILNILSYFIRPLEWDFITKISWIIFFLAISWSLLEIFTMLLNKKRRALHDFIAGTVVLKIKDSRTE